MFTDRSAGAIGQSVQAGGSEEAKDIIIIIIIKNFSGQSKCAAAAAVESKCGSAQPVSSSSL